MYYVAVVTIDIISNTIKWRTSEEKTSSACIYYHYLLHYRTILGRRQNWFDSYGFQLSWYWGPPKKVDAYCGRWICYIRNVQASILTSDRLISKKTTTENLNSRHSTWENYRIKQYPMDRIQSNDHRSVYQYEKKTRCSCLFSPCFSAVTPDESLHTTLDRLLISMQIILNSRSYLFRQHYYKE